MSYKPSIFPGQTREETEELELWLREEFFRLASSLTDREDRLRLRKLNVEPEKPREGDVVYADGTNWNPGSGSGVYVRGASSWTKL